MIKETTLYTAICDRCEKELRVPATSESELTMQVHAHRWHDTGQLHFCPDCYTIDENDEIKLKPIKPIDNEQQD